MANVAYSQTAWLMKHNPRHTAWLIYMANVAYLQTDSMANVVNSQIDSMANVAYA